MLTQCDPLILINFKLSKYNFKPESSQSHKADNRRKKPDKQHGFEIIFSLRRSTIFEATKCLVGAIFGIGLIGSNANLFQNLEFQFFGSNSKMTILGPISNHDNLPQRWKELVLGLVGSGSGSGSGS